MRKAAALRTGVRTGKPFAPFRRNGHFSPDAGCTGKPGDGKPASSFAGEGRPSPVVPVFHGTGTARLAAPGKSSVRLTGEGPPKQSRPGNSLRKPRRQERMGVLMKNRQQAIIRQLTDRELTLNIYLSQLLLFLLAGVGSFLFMGGPGNLFALMTWGVGRHLLIGITAGFFVFVADLFLMSLLPPSSYDDGGINERIFRNRPVHYVIGLAAAAAFCEELLFRGVIQTEFGMAAASLLFTLVHVRYLYKWILFIQTLCVSFLFGFVFARTGNLAAVMVMHFTIDVLLGLYLSGISVKGGGRT
jgi:hypothetical protein